MTTVDTSAMEQQATYWAPGLDDGYGGLDFTSVVPQVIACRWQNTSQLFRDREAREVMSQAIVYPEQALAIGGYLILGDAGAAVGSDPRELSGAYEIRQIGASPSLHNDEVSYKVWL